MKRVCRCGHTWEQHHHLEWLVGCAVIAADRNYADDCDRFRLRWWWPW